MLDLTNELYNKIKSAVLKLYPNALVEKKYQATTTTFPYVTIADLDNTETSHNLSYGERQSQASWKIDIYANHSTGEIVVKKIRDAIVPIMEDQYHLKRITAKPVDNVLDTTIYRYMLVYQCKIDENRKIIYS